jgi:hypothetical protein
MTKYLISIFFQLIVTSLIGQTIESLNEKDSIYGHEKILLLESDSFGGRYFTTIDSILKLRGGKINTTSFGNLNSSRQFLTKTSPSIGNEITVSYKLMPNAISTTQAGAVTSVVDFDSITSNTLDTQFGSYQKFVTSHGWEAGLFGNPSGNIQTIMGVDNYGNSKRSNLKLIWEYGYKLGNKLHTEFHLEALDTLGRTFRPITSIQPYDGSFSDIRFTADYTGFSKSPNFGLGSWEDRNFLTGLENYNYDKKIVITIPSTSSILSKYGNVASGELSLLQLESDDRFNIGNYRGIKVTNSIFLQQNAPEPYPTFYSSNKIFNFEGAIYQNLQSGQNQVNSITTNGINPLEINYDGIKYTFTNPGIANLFSIIRSGGVGINTENPQEPLHVLAFGQSLTGRKNIRLGSLTNIGESSSSSSSVIGRNIASTGNNDVFQYLSSNNGVQALFFEEDKISIDVTSGGNEGDVYIRNPTVQIFSNGNVKITSLPTFLNDADAGSGGLTEGFLYKTPTGELRVKL